MEFVFPSMDRMIIGSVPSTSGLVKKGLSVIVMVEAFSSSKNTDTSE